MRGSTCRSAPWSMERQSCPQTRRRLRHLLAGGAAAAAELRDRSSEVVILSTRQAPAWDEERWCRDRPSCLRGCPERGVTREEGQPSQHLDCPDSGHHLKEAQGPPWAPSGWAW